MADLQQARAAKNHLRLVLSGHPGVQGIGVRRLTDGYCLRVNLVRHDDDELPASIDGVPVEVRVVGPLRTQ
jgi:hypothetical protein